MFTKTPVPLVVLGHTFYDYQIIALIILAISGLGFIANCIVAFYTHTLPSMNNPFGRITAGQSTAGAICTGLFVIYVVPMIILQSDDMQMVSAHFGYVFTIVYDVTVWSHLFISCNRFVAIWFPLKYDYYFSLRNTRILMAMAWIIPCITSTILFRFYDCDVYFVELFWTFGFKNTPLCMFIATTIDYYKCMTIVVFVSAFDVTTIYKVHKTSREFAHGTVHQIQRRRIEINFLKQALLQGCFFVLELYFYFSLAWKFENVYIIFALTTGFWQFLHFTDPLIILTFNPEFRALLSAPFKNLSNISTSVAPVTNSRDNEA